MTYTYSPYALPTIDFVGGETQDLTFHAYFHKDKTPFSLARCDCSFSIVSFTNKRGVPILTKAMKVMYNDDDTVDNVLSVTLDPMDTIDLCGKYIYQLTIQDSNGDVEIPKQGILYIANNIDKNLIRQ